MGHAVNSSNVYATKRTVLFEPEGNTECWLVHGSMVVVVRLCFGLEITDHIHDPVQIKGSVKKKRGGGENI